MTRCARSFESMSLDVTHRGTAVNGGHVAPHLPPDQYRRLLPRRLSVKLGLVAWEGIEPSEHYQALVTPKVPQPAGTHSYRLSRPQGRTATPLQNVGLTSLLAYFPS